MNPSSPKRILLVDDHTLFRESLRALLEEDEAYEVVAEVATVEECPLRSLTVVQPSTSR